MMQIMVRFFVGGIVISAFAAIGDVLKPKNFAGLFSAAPSVALATLGLTLLTEGRAFAAIEARSMLAGAGALFAYTSFVSWFMMKFRPKAFLVTMSAIPLWLGIAFGLWQLWLV